MNWFNTHNIGRPVNECSHNPQACSEDDSKHLCEAFLSLAKPDMSSHISHLFGRRQCRRRVEKGETVTKFRIFQQSPPNSWKVGVGRQLQRVLHMKEAGKEDFTLRVCESDKDARCMMHNTLGNGELGDTFASRE